MFRQNRTKRLLIQGQPAYGVSHTFAHSLIAELCGAAGYDFVFIDGEHGPGGHESHLRCLQAVGGTPSTAILRVADSHEVTLKRAMDLGPEGIVIPSISTAEEAKAAIAACRYPPSGGVVTVRPPRVQQISVFAKANISQIQQENYS